jgi:hypothetical protein
MQTASPIRAVLVLSLSILCACHSSHGNGKNETAVPRLTDDEAAKYTGTYSGSLNKGIITLVLNYISGNTVSGYNVHKGVRRNFNGEVTRDGSNLNFVLKEPGNNPYDGTFYFSLDTASQKITGKWVPLDSTKTSSKTLALYRKKVDKSLLDYNWVTTGKGDTTLDFHDDGTCVLTFYERPEDSTSQLITIRGNFVSKKDTFTIDWQKNTSLPAGLMKLVRYHTKFQNNPDDPEGEIPSLKGAGLEFTIFEGD